MLVLLFLVMCTSVYAAEQDRKEAEQASQHVVLPKKKSRDIYYWSRYGTGEEVQKKLSKHTYSQDQKNHALRIASEFGNVDSVKILLGAGAEAAACNAYGLTALQVVAKPSIVQLLVDAKGSLEAPISNGGRALHSAVANNNYGVVEYILELKGDPNPVNNLGWAPLHLTDNLNIIRFC